MFHPDGSLDDQAVGELSEARLEAELAALTAEHDQHLSARRNGHDNDLKAVSRRLHALRSHLRARQEADGRRSVGNTVNVEES